jgi:hypothetical protein
MLKAPFNFGKVIEADYFTNRTKEIKRLEQNFINQTNTILISPRRWGKSSLVKNTADKLVKKNKKFKVVYIDLFNVLNEEEFYKEFARQVIKATSSKMEDWIYTARQFLSKLKPSVSFGDIPGVEIDLQLHLPDIKKNYKDILDLPESIAKSKGITILVCIDEFQNIERFTKEHVALQKKLRAQWQHHQQVVYCLYGSKRHMMMHLFESSSMPFFKFGDVFYLEKIKIEHWLPYIQKQFTSTKKSITNTQSEKIVSLMNEHPYYVQQLCQLVWLNTDKKVTDLVIDISVQDLLERNNTLFQRDYESLSETQINFLKALTCGEVNFSSQKVLKQYSIGTSANIPRVISALENKEIINKLGKQIEFSDPAFEIYFRQLFHLHKN